MSIKTVSIFTPCYNEEASVLELYTTSSGSHGLSCSKQLRARLYGRFIASQHSCDAEAIAAEAYAGTAGSDSRHAARPPAQLRIGNIHRLRPSTRKKRVRRQRPRAHLHVIRLLQHAPRGPLRTSAAGTTAPETSELSSFHFLGYQHPTRDM